MADAGAQSASSGQATEVCRQFRNNGRCQFADNCRYLHTAGEPIPVPKRDVDRPRGECFNFKEGKECKFADRCRFQHGGDDKRFDPALQAEKKRNRRRRGPAKADGAAPAGGQPEEKAQEICRNFRDRGSCKFGDQCQRIHVSGGAGAGAGAAAGQARGTAGGAAGDERSGPRRRRRRGGNKEEASQGDAPAQAGGAAGPRRQPADVTPEAARVDAAGLEICRSFRNKGKCRWNDQCRFSHVPGDGKIFVEPRAARRRQPAAQQAAGLCFSFRDNGECQYGDQCRFKHGEADNRPKPAPKRPGVCYNFRDNNKCDFGDECRFSHVLEAGA